MAKPLSPALTGWYCFFNMSHTRASCAQVFAKGSSFSLSGVEAKISCPTLLYVLHIKTGSLFPGVAIHWEAKIRQSNREHHYTISSHNSRLPIMIVTSKECPSNSRLFKRQWQERRLSSSQEKT